MTAYDIQVMNPDRALIEHFPLTASETFEVGEFVTLSANGLVAEVTDDPSVLGDIVLGVAAGSGDTTATGTSATGIGGFKYSTIGSFTPGDAALATDDLIPVYIGLPGVKFMTQNFATGGAGVAVVPTQANAMGERAGLSVTAGVHIVDTGTAAANDAFFISNVLDANRTPTELSGGAGSWVVFHMIQGLLNRSTVMA